ncbi:glyoxalase [Roseibium aquae]|uniref:Glyoxalase n=1 Tax=Roseibium aquae TaxID=1323746 RepID=A0A916TR01_9HYPH|nr:VOC family protein [Roseibium aquae]GGB63275.1 glyoxalase [Roseibium aquae]
MPFQPEHFAVWFELPVTDMTRATTFYEKVFQTELKLVEDMGPNPFAMFPVKADSGVSGHIYPGKPPARGSGPTIHLACPDGLEATMYRFIEAGGEIVSDPIGIPAGRFVYALDPDGNSIGLFSA